jgi:hypothetical protein
MFLINIKLLFDTQNFMQVMPCTIYALHNSCHAKFMFCTIHAMQNSCHAQLMPRTIHALHNSCHAQFMPCKAPRRVFSSLPDNWWRYPHDLWTLWAEFPFLNRSISQGSPHTPWTLYWVTKKSFKLDQTNRQQKSTTISLAQDKRK